MVDPIGKRPSSVPELQKELQKEISRLVPQDS